VPALIIPTPPSQTDPSDFLYPLGRIHAHDPRDRQFEISTRPELLLPPEAPLPNFLMHLPPPVMDQGNTSSCVAHAFTAKMLGQPTPWYPSPSTGRKAARMIPLPPIDYYNLIQRYDEWPGTEPSYFGTSVRAAFRVALYLGMITGYHSISSVNLMLRWLGSRKGSGVVMGTDWKSGMWDPDPEGYLGYDGQIVGGHAWFIYGFSMRRQAFRMQNSWGSGWGQKGRAWVRFATMERMLADEADCYAAPETNGPHLALSTLPPAV
jgi:hypothetical protein